MCNGICHGIGEKVFQGSKVLALPRHRDFIALFIARSMCRNRRRANSLVPSKNNVWVSEAAAVSTTRGVRTMNKLFCTAAACTPQALSPAHFHSSRKVRYEKKSIRMDAFYGHFSDFSLKVRPYRKSLILHPRVATTQIYISTK